MLCAYNFNSGACGYTSYLNGRDEDFADLPGCGVVAGEDGMDDFKFSGQPIDTVIYWRYTFLGANTLEIERSTNNSTWDSLGEFYKQ